MEPFSNIEPGSKPTKEQVKEVRREAAKIKRQLNTKSIPCSICGYNKYSVNQLHHITGVAEGGNNDPKTNLMVLCPNCHRAVEEGYIVLRVINFNENGGLIRCRMEV